MTDKNLQMAHRVAENVAAAGGKTYFVGGPVRDRLMGIDCKDIDIEIHGIEPETLMDILRALGEPVTMGASFGVFGLKHYDLDIAMPRKETATGRGHKDFLIDVDPFLGTEKAALRRDFTINAMMQDVLTGEIIDPYGGRADLKAGIIRHVCAETFVEDPLRVLRAAQFAARFGFAIAPQTIELAKTMDLTALAKERIMGELEKALLKADTPSVFFERMRQMHQLNEWFSPLEQLADVEQDPTHHPEGNVWNHTMQVLDVAASLRGEAKYPLPFMMAALTHDFGKLTATAVVNGKIHAYQHEIEGLPIAEAFLTRLTAEVQLHKYVLNMIQHHMRPNVMAQRGSKAKSFMHLFDESLCPEDLLLLAKADHMGRNDAGYPAEIETTLRDMLAEYRRRMALPCVMGRDLIEAGYRPSPAFKDALDYAHKLHLAGIDKENALRQTAAYLRKQTAAQ